jgi:hypothetical protein
MFIVNIIHDTGSLVSSQFCFDGVVEDGGEQGIQLGGGFGLQVHHFHSLLVKPCP